MTYENLKYILINIDDIPENYRSGENNIIKLSRNLVKYAVVGVTYEDYDLISNLQHTVITQQEALIGTCWWGDTRAEKKGYVTGFIDEKPKTERGIISSNEADLSAALSVMKKVAEMIIDAEISLGTFGYNENVKNLFSQAINIYDINILYEEFIGVEMPLPQAIEMNLVYQNGQRIFNPNRLIASFLR